MAGLCEGGNEPSGSLKAICKYVLPLTVISYLYVRVSRELKMQEGPLAVMMYEARTREGRSRADSSCQDFSPESSTESCPFARIGLRENPGENLNQVTCPDRDSNPGHLVSRPDALTVTPQCVELEHIRRKYLPPSMLSQSRSSLACLDLMGNREWEQKTGLFLLKAKKIRTSAVEVCDAN
ncbi:hypothetical protein ANN_16838 [Periplaneta americana]|uniref:Uncharacterized protein n=1 Tax=Periplaneta americana TaxID=6978 RepID=A0ABQ8SR86_PERAM|nr:hypothetical protein ANN_16838 [Periplaneta americana]